MTKPLGTTDFFALEAGECLNNLEALLGAGGGPPRDELVRVARALRGSALLAQQAPIAEAAASLEAVAKAVRDGRRAWDPAVAEQVGQAVDRFRELVRRAGDWNDGDAARANQLGAELASLAGGAVPAARPRRPAGELPELNAGVRAFVAREGALIASALDRASRTLQSEPRAREPLFAVLRRMQSLRGLAELSDLSPLPDILDGVELAIGDLTRVFAPPPGVPGVLDAAAQALSRVCRDVAEHGRPVPDAEEARRFTDRLLRAFAAEPDVVAIETLYVADDAEPMRRADGALAGAAPAPLGPLELVSQGEYFALTADLLTSAGNATERDLRLYGLAVALRPLSRARGEPAAESLAGLARAAGERIADGEAAADTAGVAALLREAGALLRSDADAGVGLGPALDRLAAQLAVARRTPEPPRSVGPEAPAPATEAPIVPIEALAYDGEPALADMRRVVPIESLAPGPEADARPIVPIESLAPGPATPVQSVVAAGAEPALTAFEMAFRRYRQLLSGAPAGGPALDALLAAAEPPAPAAERAPEHTVQIAALCYRGRGALRRAAEVRHAIADQLAHGVRPDAMRPLLDELLDLVPLALDDA